MESWARPGRLAAKLVCLPNRSRMKFMLRGHVFLQHLASLHASNHSPWRRPRGLQTGKTGACHLQQKSIVRSQWKIEFKLKAAHSPLQRVTNHARPRPADVLSFAASISLRRPAPPQARFRGRRQASFATYATALVVQVSRPKLIARLGHAALLASDLAGLRLYLRLYVPEELRRKTPQSLPRS